MKKSNKGSDRLPWFLKRRTARPPSLPWIQSGAEPASEEDRLRARIDLLRIEIQELHRIINRHALEERFAGVLFVKGARVAYRRLRGRLRYLKYAIRQRSFKVSGLADSPRFESYPVTPLHRQQPDRPRVLHLIANFVTGGSARLVVDLIERLGHRYDQEVITAKLPVPPHYTGIRIVEHERFRESCDALAHIEARRPDLVHVHYVADPDAEYSARDWDWYDKLFLALEHYVRQHPCRIVENINIPVPPYISACVDRYVYVSEHVRERFGLYGAAALTIYPGSDLERFHRSADRIIPDDTIGMVYRLQPDKLDEQSIEPFIRAVQQRPGTRAVIVGGGYYLESYCNAVDRAGLSAAFTFTGYVAYSDLPSLLEQMSIFVAPVHSESFGQVSPFAMGMGLPVAGYAVGALEEIIDDGALLAPAGDSEALARLIVDLLDDRERRLRIGARNRLRAEQQFSVEAMTRSYESLYDELLATGAARA